MGFDLSLDRRVQTYQNIDQTNIGRNGSKWLTVLILLQKVSSAIGSSAAVETTSAAFFLLSGDGHDGHIHLLVPGLPAAHLVNTSYYRLCIYIYILYILYIYRCICICICVYGYILRYPNFHPKSVSYGSIRFFVPRHGSSWIVLVIDMDPPRMFNSSPENNRWSGSCSVHWEALSPCSLSPSTCPELEKRDSKANQHSSLSQVFNTFHLT